MAFEDLPDGRSSEVVAESVQFAADTALAHVGFCVAISMMSRRISVPVDGRPGERAGCAGCPGYPVHVVKAWAIAPSRDRSPSVRTGRSTWRRSTMSSWRNTMISTSLERPERTARRANNARKRYKMRYTVPHHRAPSCLVNTHDRISGTHRGSILLRDLQPLSWAFSTVM